LLLRRYVKDHISATQNLAAPVWSMLKEDSNFIPSGDGVYFPISISGNDANLNWHQ